MKGLGCNKDKVIQALCTICNWQRQEVAKAFKQQYGKDLIGDLKSELSGDFEGLVLALMEPPLGNAYYVKTIRCQQLHKAMAGLGTRESVLIEIMTTRSNAQIQELKYTYKQLYGSELKEIVLQCGSLRANQDARALYRAGEQRLGTDESSQCYFAAQNMAQLRLVFQEYQTFRHSDGLLAIVKSIRSRPGFFAELIHKSMVGLGTRDNDLIRLIVTRSEIDLADIRNIYPSLFNTSLEKAIAGDCSGAYKEGLIALVKGN
uniref:Annexin n=1 Tax=Ditylenchus dipsaci TaxID=166011 RepID=A0A915ERL1_9BILA